MKELKIDEKQNNKKLDSWMQETFPYLPKSTFFKALRKKDIRVNGTRIKENIVIHTGDTIQLFIPDTLFEPTILPIYEDENILIVNKPCKIPVTGENSLTVLLQHKYSCSIQPCHRLDTNTSGLVLFAKDEITREILLDKFQKQEITKKYIAKIYGIFPKKQDTLIAYLFKDTKKSMVYISAVPKTGYRKIITHYTVLQENKKENTSVLDITLETGRTHQIRAHFAFLGHPIIGDSKYGKNEINKKFREYTQHLYSYCITFSFTTDAGKLNYLTGKEVLLKEGATLP